MRGKLVQCESRVGIRMACIVSCDPDEKGRITTKIYSEMCNRGGKAPFSLLLYSGNLQKFIVSEIVLIIFENFYWLIILNSITCLTLNSI